jgi:hypothetical protein
VLKNKKLKNLIRNSDRNFNGKIKIRTIKRRDVFQIRIVLSSRPYLLKNKRCCCQIRNKGMIVIAKANNSSVSSNILEKVFGTSRDIISNVIENANTASLKFSSREGLSLLILNVSAIDGIF